MIHQKKLEDGIPSPLDWKSERFCGILDGNIREVFPTMNEHRWHRSSLLLLPILFLGALLVTCNDSPTEPCSFGVEGAGEVTAPEKISSPQPQYTDAARQARIQGVVILQAVVNCHGRVEDVTVLKSLDPGLDRNSVDAVSRWTFRPATQDGKPISVYYNFTVNFRLQEQVGSVVQGEFF